MATWFSELASSSNFVLTQSDFDALSATAPMRPFAWGLVLAQDFSRKKAYDQLQTVARAGRSAQGSMKLGLIAKYFLLVAEIDSPMEVYQETQLCLLSKQVLMEVSQTRESLLWRKTLQAVFRGLMQLLIIIRAPDSLGIVRKALESQMRLLGDDIIMRLSSDDSSFLSGTYGGVSGRWIAERLNSLTSLILSELSAGRLTLLAPMLYTAVKSSPTPLTTSEFSPLLDRVFGETERKGLVLFSPPAAPAARVVRPARQNPAPTSVRRFASQTTTEFPSVQSGLQWLYGKVLEDVQTGVKVNIIQVAYECERLVFGQSAPLQKDGKQDLFEAFDALMGQETATRETVSCWELLLSGLGKLRVLEQVEWEALREKLSRLSHRNQYLRDIGKKRPARVKRAPPDYQTERKKASRSKRLARFS